MVGVCDHGAIMPQNCSVPCCTKKVYEENGKKISFHNFPDNEGVFRQWIVAIRRDSGGKFSSDAKLASLLSPF